MHNARIIYMYNNGHIYVYIFEIRYIYLYIFLRISFAAVFRG